MRKSIAVSVLFCGLVVAGCGGDKGGGGTGGGGGAAPSNSFTGAWHPDLSAVIEAQRAMVLEQMKPQLEAIREQMKTIDALPADQRDEAKKQMWEQIPAEQRELAQAMIAGEKEAAAVVSKMFDEKMSGLKATIDIKDDKTYSWDFAMGEDKDSGTGTWASEGSSITLTPKVKNGKPAEGEDAMPMKLTRKGDTLEGKTPKTGETLTLKR